MLEKILEEIIEQLKEEGCIIDNDAGNRAEEIIRKHMNDGKDINVPINNNWIPVEERLPKDDRYVLVCNVRGAMDLARWDGKRWWTGFSHADIARNIISWKSIPEPYIPKKGAE